MRQSATLDACSMFTGRRHVADHKDTGGTIIWAWTLVVFGLGILVAALRPDAIWLYAGAGFTAGGTLWLLLIAAYRSGKEAQRD